MPNHRCEECKEKLPDGQTGRCARCAYSSAPPPPRQHAIHVDPDLALDYRVARLEELELLRLALHQAHEQYERCVESKLANEAQHWAEQTQEAQKKIAAIVGGINKTVRSRLDERDRRKEQAS